ncbi:MAG TPA: class I SAM-dependent methyltransferase [Xanthobacteraceae bacterium]|nr:class I SAM-dependent methyltransferase [Xanthobacteraceae bacterium]
MDSSSAHAPVDAKIIADIETVERFTLHWDANAGAYAENLGELRAAARRLLPLTGAVERLRDIADQIACLARNPLYFTETFHGQRLGPDGRLTPLEHADRVHFWPVGLLSTGDRRAIETVYDRILQDRRGPLRIVEVGSATGRGSARIAGEFVRTNCGFLYCIDAWDDPTWHLAFLANMQIFDLESVVVAVRSPSREAARLFDDKSLDAVFLDGSHIYPNVVADIDAYLPKVRENGFLFGHDLHDVPSRFNRAELLTVAGVNNTDVDYVNAQGEVVRENVHPGVILAVHDRFGDDVERFPESTVWAKQVPGYASSHFTRLERIRRLAPGLRPLVGGG